jgi:hypothetical protein
MAIARTPSSAGTCVLDSLGFGPTSKIWEGSTAVEHAEGTTNNRLKLHLEDCVAKLKSGAGGNWQIPTDF